ncbi:MAG: hypothetical protein R2762_31250, partial [Bryobacteraceae bacterium]
CLRQEFRKGNDPSMDGEMSNIRPDDVLDDFREGSIDLTTRTIPASGQGDVPMIEIEGDADSLRFLGRLILAQADFPLDCGYGISPRGAGSIVFSPKAELGIYLHRIPCMDQEQAEDAD